MNEYTIITVNMQHNSYRLHSECNAEDVLLSLGFPQRSLSSFMNEVYASGYETRQLPNGKFVEVEIP